MSLKIIRGLLSLVALAVSGASAAAPNPPSTPKRASNSTAAAKQGASNSTGSSCVKGVPEFYGLVGLDKPADMTSPVCRAISKSCCSAESFQKISNYWGSGNQSASISAYFAENEMIFSDVFKLISDVSAFAGRTLNRTQSYNSSNCKILSRRVLTYQPDLVLPQLLESIKKMNRQFKEQFKGQYCSACDAMNHQFYKTGSSEVTFSQKFCRDIVTGTLHNLLYLHGHLPKFLRLSARLVTHCNSTGAFNEKPFAPELNIVEQAEDVKVLETCKSYRNDNAWFSNCVRVCEKYSFAKFSKYFNPYLSQLTGYNKTLSAMLNQTVFEEQNPSLKNRTNSQNATNSSNSTNTTVQKSTQTVRVLAEPPAKSSKSLTSQDQQNKTATNDTNEITKPLNFTIFSANPVIFPGAENSKIDLKTFKVKFAQFGIDMTYEGENTIISDSKKALKKKVVLKRHLKGVPAWASAIVLALLVLVA